MVVQALWWLLGAKLLVQCAIQHAGTSGVVEPDQQQFTNTTNQDVSSTLAPLPPLLLSDLIGDNMVVDLHPCPASCTCIRGDGGAVIEASCTGAFDASMFGLSLITLELIMCSDETDMSRLWFSLKSLKIRNCSSLFAFKDFRQLRNLTINHSVLPKQLDCRVLRHLTYLSLSSTDLDSLEIFSRCQDQAYPLRVLDLSGTRLSAVDWGLLEMFPRLETVDLGHNPNLSLISGGSVNRPFKHLTSLSLRSSPELRVLCNKVLAAMPAIANIDLIESGLAVLPSHLFKLGNLTTILLSPTMIPHCTCQLNHFVQHTSSKQFSSLNCRLTDSGQLLLPAASEVIATTLGCSPPTINTFSNSQIVEPGNRITLDCLAATAVRPEATVLWLTPRLELLRRRPDDESECDSVDDQVALTSNINDYSSWPNHLSILANGSLLIDHFGWRDRGNYTCYLANSYGNDTATLKLDLDYEYRNVLYYWSILFGFVTAVSFLGCCCCCACCGPCCADEPAPRIKRLTTMVDSIETYRIQQLEKLRENYQLNSQRIRDNYSLQVERMREHYSNSRGVPQVATESYQSVKDQYFDQINKMRDYSNAQLAKSHENYIFQRQRLRKFSAQNYLKIRETGKYTQKTLNRVLENMPAVADLTSCRQGQVPPDWDEGRSDGLELHQIDGVGEMDGLYESSSLYFTPSGTPLADGGGRAASALYSPVYSPGVETSSGPKERKGHRRMVSNLSNFFPFWWGMGQTDDGPVTTVAIVEPVQEQFDTNDLKEVMIEATLEEEELAPLAQEESLDEEDFTDAHEEDLACLNKECRAKRQNSVRKNEIIEDAVDFNSLENSKPGHGATHYYS